VIKCVCVRHFWIYPMFSNGWLGGIWI